MALFRNDVVRGRYRAVCDGGALAVGYDLAGEHIRIDHRIYVGHLHLSVRFFQDSEKEYQPHSAATEQSMPVCLPSVAELCAHSGHDDAGIHSPALSDAQGCFEHHLSDHRHSPGL